MASEYRNSTDQDLNALSGTFAFVGATHIVEIEKKVDSSENVGKNFEKTD